MYKFTNGIVVFDKETRDAFIRSGMTLIKEKNNEDNSGNKPIERKPKQVRKTTK